MQKPLHFLHLWILVNIYNQIEYLQNDLMLLIFVLRHLKQIIQFLKGHLYSLLKHLVYIFYYLLIIQKGSQIYTRYFKRKYKCTFKNWVICFKCRRRNIKSIKSFWRYSIWLYMFTSIYKWRKWRSFNLGKSFKR